MKILPKHLLIESLAVWVLAFYLAMAMTVLVGVIIWLFGIVGSLVCDYCPCPGGSASCSST